MILLDTNVVLEPIRNDPEPLVSAWLDAQALETLFLSAITVAELRYGVRSLPKGRRRDRLDQDLENLILPMFTGRILSFDLACSLAFAQLMGKARLTGLAIPAANGYIAAIASASAMTIASRDTAPFEAAGLKTVNPWIA
ncbi:MAG: type II toxin-antitoxin system VapC family toxin [Gammaproteobacteria bacterium]|nr:type II toxin-antitoxin system VapC family toxin [Gammaproteobacteria bacterium]